MSQSSVQLKQGLILDGRPQREAVIRESTAGDVIDASCDSEKLILNESGEYELVPSPTMMASLVLCKQIVSIGEIKGPLTLNELKKLSPTDMKLLQDEAEKLELAAVAAEHSEKRKVPDTDSTAA